ncbi:hypothetical protein L2E82_31053 [Cichorium intybus]|uniref:Uncharacterized protein n=1 Tax=Cichorium intybus TaxID=13427 RepID=A0ACB9D2C5_CICIN|nr:hypothetical protein L2E82_31053 [Cichorium intybus]
MDTIIKKIEEAYIQNQEATSTITVRSYPSQNLKSFEIPLKAINLATKEFSKVNRIGDDGNDQINIHSFHMLTDIAYQCISLKLKDRPRMNRVIKSIEEAMYIQNNGVASTITQPDNQYENLERFLIPLKEIILATEDFSSKCQIGDGGFGVVYRGQLSNRGQTRTVAIKRLNPQEIAFECISLNLEERPTMDTIMERIEDAMDFQEHMKCKRMKS